LNAQACEDEDQRKNPHRLTRTRSATATRSEAENLPNYFNHKKCERAAGSRRLQRFVRPNDEAQSLT
jgi:hypothetical protein